VIHAGTNRSATDVTPAAIDAVRAKLGLHGPFVLHVGAVDPHKNFVAVLAAFAGMRRVVRGSKLVVVGKSEQQQAIYREYCRRNGLSGDVLFPGFLPRTELEALYASATALAFLSKAEGFGFPVLEAMAHGCPVVTSTAGAIPEVAGDAALSFAPDDLTGASRALVRLCREPSLRDELKRRGRARATAFTWPKTAQATLAVWARLAGIRSAAPLAPALQPSR
jgi:glycosyltransferase involved in cell wall biosynthesis